MSILFLKKSKKFFEVVLKKNKQTGCIETKKRCIFCITNEEKRKVFFKKNL